ncbi:choline ethanolamine [Babesia ovata]|uniref:ethanolamine kinase n=1 Tax=Babesia ovata TaxID=189622 RepID=A0A2H6KC61_9APIC|nr:choline ethanolamine [Babesia ovata]GBE60581.1 choline ethanolamine [Babesia ovata]
MIRTSDVVDIITNIDGVRDVEVHLTHDEIVIYCVRLANVQLGIDVSGLDLKGELKASDFDYLVVDEIIGGLTNLLHKVTNTRNGNHVAVRIFGHKTDEFIDRSRERIIQNHLCLQGFAKHVYAHFEGGQIEEWLPGEAVSDADFHSYKYSHLIARQLHRLHTLPGQRELYLQLHPHVSADGEVKFESALWPSVWKFYDLCMANIGQLEPIISGKFSLTELKEHIKRMQTYCDSARSPVVLCHCDLLNANVIINGPEEATFLDFEYACFMERGFDIANHFIEHCGIECNWEDIPDEVEQRRFLAHYLGDTATDSDVDMLYMEIQPFFIAANVYWGLWGFLQCIYSSHDVDYPHYARSRVTCAIHDDRWKLFDCRDVSIDNA